MRKHLLAIFCFLIYSVDAYASHSMIEWGIDRTVNPNRIGVNVNNSWKDLATIDSSGAWKLFSSNIVNIDSFNAIGDGITNDAIPLINAMSFFGANGGIVELSCNKNYYIASNITIPVNITIRHCRPAGWHGNPGIDWSTGPINSQPHVKLNPLYSFTFSSNSGYEGVVLNSTLTFPVLNSSGYSGIAFKVPSSGSNDIHLDALVVGFASCYDGSANFSNRYKINLECDGSPSNSAGSVILGPSLDTAIGQIRSYPWGTAAFPGGINTRPGYGIQIVSGINDDTKLDLMDYGHSRGIVTSANGNVHYNHIWTDNNSSYGFHALAGDRNQISYMALYNSLGARFEANGTWGIGYLLCDSGSVPSSECIETASSVSPVLNISSIDIKKTSLYAINIGSITARINIGSANMSNIHGNVGPYIVGVAGWTSEQVQFGTTPKTDLTNGSSLFGGNAQSFKNVTSAATFALPTDYDHYTITGSSTITNITGAWNDRRIILTCDSSSTASINSTGNVILSSAGTFNCSNGASIALWYDQSYSTKWREMWRN